MDRTNRPVFNFKLLYVVTTIFLVGISLYVFIQLKNLIEASQDGQTIHQAYFNCLLKSNDKKNYYHQMNFFLQKNFPANH